MKLAAVITVILGAFAPCLANTYQLQFSQMATAPHVNGCSTDSGASSLAPAQTALYSSSVSATGCGQFSNASGFASLSFANGLFQSNVNSANNGSADETGIFDDSITISGAIPGQTVNLFLSAAVQATPEQGDSFLQIAWDLVPDWSTFVGRYGEGLATVPGYDESVILQATVGQTIYFQEIYETSCGLVPASTCFVDATSAGLQITDGTPGTSFTSASGIDYSTLAVTPEPHFYALGALLMGALCAAKLRLGSIMYPCKGDIPIVIDQTAARVEVQTDPLSGDRNNAGRGLFIK